MTGRQVALLRGINVGRAKRVAMAELRALVEALGFGEVRTLLNSGNVVFTGDGDAPDRVAERIEQALVERTGVASRVTVLTAAEVATVIAENPVPDDGALDPSRLLVAVLRDPRDRERLAPLLTQEWAPDVLALGTRVAYLHCPGGILPSRLPDAVARALGDAATARNWATMNKLHALTAV